MDDLERKEDSPVLGGVWNQVISWQSDAQLSCLKHVFGTFLE